MPISAERLALATEELHRAAEGHHRHHGHVVPALLLVPADGHPYLCVAPQGLPPADRLRALVRRARATAVVLAGEAWLSMPGIRAEALQSMPLDDLARLEEDPQRQDAIVTTGVGITPDGTTTILKVTVIEHGASGETVLRPLAMVDTGPRTDGIAAYLAGLLT